MSDDGVGAGAGVELIKNQGPGLIAVSVPSSKGASGGTTITIASDPFVVVFVVVFAVAFFFVFAVAPSPFTSGYLAEVPRSSSVRWRLGRSESFG